MPTRSFKVSIATKGDAPEVGVVSSGAILFSTFSFFGKVHDRIAHELASRGWEHDPTLDGGAAALLERAFAGEDVFDWSWLSEAQKKVLGELRGVRGVITYGELARRCGTSPRAVGSIMRSNPFAFFVPCHRVVAKDGEGGFSIGLDEKRALLEKEAKAARRG